MKIIGLDPAFRKNGFGYCVLEMEGKKVVNVSFDTFPDFMAFFQWVMSFDSEAIFGVENSNLQNSTFGRYHSGAKGLNKISRNVGANQAVSQITVDILKWRFEGKNVIEFSPKEKGSKWSLYEAQSALVGLNVANSKVKMTQDQRDALKISILTLEKSKIIGLI